MKAFRLAALAAVLAVPAGAGTAVLAKTQGQTRMIQGPRAVDVMISGGSQIGVSVRDLEELEGGAPAGAAAGVTVEDVRAGSPAEQAGIRKGDLIVEFDGERVRSVRQLTRLVQETPAGRRVEAVLLREGQRTPVSITTREGERFSFSGFDDLGAWARDVRARVAPRPPAAPAAPAVPALPPSPWNLADEIRGRATVLGVTVGALSSQLADYFGTTQGVLVTSVEDGSAGAQAGLRAGDVITTINGSAVQAPADVRRLLRDLNAGDEFTIVVMRDRAPLTLKGTAERRTPPRPVAPVV